MVDSFSDPRRFVGSASVLRICDNGRRNCPIRLHASYYRGLGRTPLSSEVFSNGANRKRNPCSGGRGFLGDRGIFRYSSRTGAAFFFCSRMRGRATDTDVVRQIKSPTNPSFLGLVLLHATKRVLDCCGNERWHPGWWTLWRKFLCIAFATFQGSLFGRGIFHIAIELGPAGWEFARFRRKNQ